MLILTQGYSLGGNISFPPVLYPGPREGKEPCHVRYHMIDHARYHMIDHGYHHVTHHVFQNEPFLLHYDVDCCLHCLHSPLPPPPPPPDAR